MNRHDIKLFGSAVVKNPQTLLGVVLMLFLSWTVPALADKSHPLNASGERLALVIGNKDYPKRPLINPVNDARDIKAALEKVGFRVIYRENADLAGMDNAVREFVHHLGKDTVGLFYYSGHGAQADGSNFLIPVGADIESKSELKARAYDASIILGEMQEVGNQVNIVILDACRNSPYKGLRGTENGMASMFGPKGSIIAYSTAPGSVADDNTSGRNGLYTSYLKKYLVQPGLTIEEMFKKVRESVLEENRDQVPWENSSIIGQFCFAGCGSGYPQALPDSDVSGNELRFWNSIQDSHNPADFQAYLSQYPEGRYRNLANYRLSSLEIQPASSGCSYCPEMTSLPIGIQMGKYEVTQGQWLAVMGNNPSKFSRCGLDCPVENISWLDVQNYIQRLNAQTGKHFRLPSEDEWFAACQAGGNQSEFCNSGNIDQVAWHRGNSGPSTHPVGRKMANAWNLYDMSGNVWEWTDSCEKQTCSRRFVRGGSWDGMEAFMRSTVRVSSLPADHYTNLGFRLVQDQ
jgi:hypothetical protein